MNYFKQNHFISKLILGGLTVLLVLFLNIGNLFSSPFLYKFKDFKYPFSNYLISKKKENNTKFFIKSKHIEITNAYVKIPIGNLSTTAAYMTITSEINDKIISTEVFSEQFVCDLSKCKGACCVEGDGGAPLKESERMLIKKNLEKIKPFMNKKGIDTIEKTDFYYEDEDDLPATQLVDKKECVFVYFNKENNHAMCAIENAFNAGEISFNKPISLNYIYTQIMHTYSTTNLQNIIQIKQDLNMFTMK